MSRLWRRLRRNAGSVAAVLAREAVRPANLLGLVGVAVGLGSLGWSVVALSGGQFVSTGVFGAAALVALYGAGTSLTGNPLRGATVFVAGLLLVGGVTHALGVGPADTAEDDPASDYAVIDNPEVSSDPVGDEDQDQDDSAESAEDTDPLSQHGAGGCGGSIAP